MRTTLPNKINKKMNELRNNSVRALSHACLLLLLFHRCPVHSPKIPWHTRLADSSHRRTLLPSFNARTHRTASAEEAGDVGVRARAHQGREGRGGGRGGGEGPGGRKRRGGRWEWGEGGVRRDGLRAEAEHAGRTGGGTSGLQPSERHCPPLPKGSERCVWAWMDQDRRSHKRQSEGLKESKQPKDPSLHPIVFFPAPAFFGGLPFCFASGARTPYRHLPLASFLHTSRHNESFRILGMMDGEPLVRLIFFSPAIIMTMGGVSSSFTYLHPFSGTTFNRTPQRKISRAASSSLIKLYLPTFLVIQSASPPPS